VHALGVNWMTAKLAGHIPDGLSNRLFYQGFGSLPAASPAFVSALLGFRSGSTVRRLPASTAFAWIVWIVKSFRMHNLTRSPKLRHNLPVTAIESSAQSAVRQPGIRRCYIMPAEALTLRLHYLLGIWLPEPVLGKS
jgi:hypothetical protein